MRRQFGAKGQEQKLIAYPMHQHRLITRFVDSLVHFVGANRMVDMWIDNLPNLLDPTNDRSKLCHGLCSNLKAFMAWHSQDTIAESRRACGGLGYSYSSLFSVLSGINDLNSTWEGDNHVLMMQTQQFLLKGLEWVKNKKPAIETLEFLSLTPPDLTKHNCCIYDLEGLKNLFRARAANLVLVGAHIVFKNKGSAEIIDELQSRELRDMCQGYFDTYSIDTFMNFIAKIENKDTKAIYEKVLLLHIQHKIVSNEAYFYDILGEEKIDNGKCFCLHF